MTAEAHQSEDGEGQEEVHWNGATRFEPIRSETPDLIEHPLEPLAIGRHEGLAPCLPRQILNHRRNRPIPDVNMVHRDVRGFEFVRELEGGV